LQTKQLSVFFFPDCPIAWSRWVWWWANKSWCCPYTNFVSSYTCFWCIIDTRRQDISF
jgi:hypothetical protein